ncbi:MAG: hypothetical protein H7Y86_15260 [Rhizobacter sp.]|nr:hypothetical protein [Ferruginibacter sp.]
MKKVSISLFVLVFSMAAVAQQKHVSNTEPQQFILLFRFKSYAPPPTPDQIKASREKWELWMGGLAQQGKLLGGEQISFSGITISGFKKAVANNPVIANNEMVTGYMLLSAKDLREAEGIAKDCPILAFNGSVELRQIQPQLKQF